MKATRVRNETKWKKYVYSEDTSSVRCVIANITTALTGTKVCVCVCVCVCGLDITVLSISARKLAEGSKVGGWY
jgi:hypothetical protein